ncbi:kinesin-related protein 4 isoform X2 [Patella vulgata]|uniref:kinesin-related protein 4 isoform X2 n=1 Tax=Patella vulgata TaxID=6465 RepID=UPI00217F703A|nr:kinesin-related protein 4 isoform X2 [Patella vulgata]
MEALQMQIPCNKENTPIKEVKKSVDNLKRSVSPLNILSDQCQSGKKAPSIRRILGDLPTPKTDNVTKKKSRSFDNTTCQRDSFTPVRNKSLRKSVGGQLASKNLSSTKKPDFSPGKHKFEIRPDAFENKDVHKKNGEQFVDHTEWVIPVPIRSTIQNSFDTSPAIPHIVIANQDDECEILNQQDYHLTSEDDTEISEFIDLVLNRCLEDVLSEDTKVNQIDVPAIQVIPATPLEEDEEQTTSDNILADNPPVLQLDNFTTEDTSQIDSKNIQPFENINSANIQSEQTDFNSQFCDIFSDNIENDSDKENVQPVPNITSFSSLHIECDDDVVYSPTSSPYSLSYMSVSNFGDENILQNNLPFSIFSPDVACSPICYKNYQNSNSKRTILASLPILQNDDSGEISESCDEKIEEYDVCEEANICENVQPSTILDISTHDMGCSPLKDTITYSSIETNTDTKNFNDISVLTETVDVNSVGLSPIKGVTKDIDTMTTMEAMLNKSMETEHVSVFDKSMMAQCDFQDESMMTDSTPVSNVETTMTPFKLLNKKGKRMTAEEVRRQHPRIVANQIDTTLVCNEKLQSEITILTKDNTRLKTVIKDLKVKLKTTCKELEEFESIRKEEKKDDQKSQDEKLKSLHTIISNQEERLKNQEKAYNTLQNKIQEYEACQLQLEKDVVEKQQQYETELNQQSVLHTDKLEKMKIDELNYKEQYEGAKRIVKEQEIQLVLLTEVEEEADKLMKKQDILMRDLYNMRAMIKGAVNNNISTKQHLQLQWNNLEEKKSQVGIIVEGYKMNNKLLLEEMADLQHVMTEKNKKMEEKYLSTIGDLEMAATEYYAQQTELSEARSTIESYGNLESDLTSAYKEIQTLQSTLKQTEDTLHHEQYRYTNLQEEFVLVKQDFQDQVTQLENLVLNLQRTVDFREKDIDKLEIKLYNDYNKLEEQKEQLDSLETQLFNCQEEIEQKTEELERVQRFAQEQEGVGEICLQSAREADEKNTKLTLLVNNLQTINKENEEKQSQLLTSFGQLQQDYLASRENLKETQDRHRTTIAGKDEELDQAKYFLLHLDSKITAYIDKLKSKISHEVSNRRKLFRQAIDNISASSQERLVDIGVEPIASSTHASLSILGPNAKPHRHASSLSPTKDTFPYNSFNQSHNSLNTSVYNHVTTQSNTPSKSFSISEETQRSCHKLDQLVERRRRSRSSTAVKSNRHLDYGEVASENVKDCPVLFDSCKDVDSSTDVYKMVERKFDEVERLVAALEKNTIKTMENLTSEKDDLEDIKYRLERQVHLLKSEIAVRSEAISQVNEEKTRLDNKVQELTDCLVKYSDQHEQIKIHERNNEKLNLDLQCQKDEIKLLTEELDMLFSKTRRLNSNGSDDQQQLFELKRKNQQLRMKIIEDYNSYIESDSQNKRKMQTLEDNWLQSKAEVSRYSELVDTIKETLKTNKDYIEEVPSLNQLLNIIKGSDITATTPATDIFHSFYDSFMF